MNSPAKRINRRSNVGSLSRAVIVLFATTLLANAQRPAAELLSINPPIANAGQTVEISLSGTNLDDVNALHFSNLKITAKPVMLPQSEFHKFQKQSGTRFSVTIPADVSPGVVELRAKGYFGLSTSRPFLIVPAKTVLTKETGAANHALETAPELAPEAIAYGTMDASQLDYWKFAAKKGERFTISCRSEFFDAQADATLVVVDGAGNELARNRDFSSSRDPLLDFTAPADGNFWVGVHDFIYNGGANFFYTLTVSQKPQIDFVFPPSVQPGKTARVKLYGRNLPGGSMGEGLVRDGTPLESIEVDITAPAEVSAPVSFTPDRPSHALLPGFDYSVQDSSPIRIGFANGPVISENPAEKAAQKIVIPAEVVGRFDERADEDRYRFTAKKGTSYWVESISDRLASVTDSYILVEKITTAADGKETLAKVRDNDDEAGTGGAKFDTTTRDSILNFTADQDGDYQVTIINQFASGGAEKLYRLAIREAKPDFELLAVPERPTMTAQQVATVTPLLRKNGTASIRIALTRRDGFSGPVQVSAKNLPEGVTAPAITIDPASSTGLLVFSAPKESKPWDGVVEIQGTANDGALVKTARVGSIPLAVADNRTQRLRARLDQQFPLSLSQHEIEILRIELAEPGKPLTVEMDGTVEIKFKVVDEVKGQRKGNLVVTPFGLQGIGSKPPTVSIAESKTDGVLKIAAKKVANVFTPVIGKHSFVLRGTGTVKYIHNPEAVKRIEEEKAHIVAVTKKLNDDLANAKKEAAAAKAAFDTATKNLATATAETKPEAAKTLTAATAANGAAQKSVTALDAKVKIGANETKAVDARLAAAKKKATAKDTLFAVVSTPLVLEIKEKPKAAPKPAEKK